MTALIVGTLLALAALAFVLYPLFAEPEARPDLHQSKMPALPGEDAVAALREIEFDRATGKLSDTDYNALKLAYTERALAAMRASESGASTNAEISRFPGAIFRVDGTAGATDAAEDAIRRRHSSAMQCPACGPRPESDALYCSDCGRYMPGACTECGAEVGEPGARFCPRCGHVLAA